MSSDHGNSTCDDNLINSMAMSSFNISYPWPVFIKDLNLKKGLFQFNLRKTKDLLSITRHWNGGPEKWKVYKIWFYHAIFLFPKLLKHQIIVSFNNLITFRFRLRDSEKQRYSPRTSTKVLIYWDHRFQLAKPIREFSGGRLSFAHLCHTYWVKISWARGRSG